MVYRIQRNRIQVQLIAPIEKANYQKKNMKAVLLLVQQVKHLLISTLPRMILNCRPLKSRLK